MSAGKHTIAEAVEAFDDEALLKMMRHQLVTTFPAFDQNPRVKAVRDRLMREVEALPDLLEALVEAERVLLVAVTHRVHVEGFDPADHVTIKRIRAALAKAGGGR